MSGRSHRSLCGLGVALALLTAGCASMPAHGPVALAPLAATTPTVMSTPTSSSTSWDGELRGATRRVEAYDWAMRQADLRATLITPRLRQAFAREQTRFHGRFARDAAKELLAMGVVDEGVDATAIARPGNEEQVLVVAAFYVADQRHRDLAMKGSIWDVALVVDGVRVKPLAIEPIRVTPSVQDLLPYVDRFDDLYLLRFPLVDAATGVEPLSLRASALHLEIASALATCDVSWSFEGAPR
jgi:hypothetical protein